MSNSASAHTQAAAPIAREQIDPVFQPIVDLSRGEIAGFESLCRPKAGGRFANAGEMFDWAEKNHALWPLEEITRAASLEAASEWPAGTQLFVNTSPEVFADSRFGDTILRMVRATRGLSPGRVVLEITERSEQQHVAGLEEQVRRVRSYGFQIAIDDVGAGTSGLNRIMALRPNWLKLDRELVDGVQADRVRQNLIRFFLHFARLSGVQLVAEGIERESDLATLIELGVPFGQGYYLGRPGSREQTLDPELSEWLRRRWTAADAARFRDPQRVRVARFARPAETAAAIKPVREVAGTLLRQLSLPGVAVTDGKRYLGWCEREHVLRAACDAQSSQPIGFLVGSDPLTASIDTTVADAMDIALSRDDRAIHTPLVLTDNGQIAGMLTVRDLLHAAAEMVADSHARTAPLTGLPGRVRTDEHLADLIAKHSGSHNALVLHQEPGPDAAFIDIANFHDYNGAYGYELGDELLKQLTAMIQTLVVRGEPGAFLGHLGDDRFLVTASSTTLLRRLERLARQFDHAVTRSQSDKTESAPEAPAQHAEPELHSFVARKPVGLRVVYLEDPFRRVESIRDLYRLADETRSAAQNDASRTAPPGVIAARLPTPQLRQKAG